MEINDIKFTDKREKVIITFQSRDDWRDVMTLTLSKEDILSIEQFAKDNLSINDRKIYVRENEKTEYDLIVEYLSDIPELEGELEYTCSQQKKDADWYYEKVFMNPEKYISEKDWQNGSYVCIQYYYMMFSDKGKYIGYVDEKTQPHPIFIADKLPSVKEFSNFKFIK